MALRGTEDHKNQLFIKYQFMQIFKIQKIEKEMELLERAGEMIEDTETKEELNQKVMILQGKIYKQTKKYLTPHFYAKKMCSRKL